jgi:hypothetical protein
MNSKLKDGACTDVRPKRLLDELDAEDREGKKQMKETMVFVEESNEFQLDLAEVSLY